MLIVLRGNSGSSKSTVGRLLQEELGGSTALLQQDYFCRVIYREPEQRSMAHADLLELGAIHCLDAGQNVILDGIFNARLYAGMLQRIASRADESYFFAFDLTFDETARRHALRSQAQEFTVDELRSWYHGWQPLPFVEEQRIGPDESASAIVHRILHVRSDQPTEAHLRRGQGGEGRWER